MSEAASERWEALAESLSTDEAAWRDFLADPAAAIRRSGLELSPEAAARLAGAVGEAQRRPDYVPGWAISRLKKDLAQDTFTIINLQVSSNE